MNPISSCPRRLIVTAAITVVVKMLSCSISNAQSNPAVESPAQSTAVHPWQDDAALHCVQFVGRKTGWAGGDHGTLWTTGDGGESWSRLPVPTDASIRGLHFLTNKFGFIAGRTTQPYTRSGLGVLLRTRDGGRTWEAVGHNLPPLSYVRFFGPDDGVVVGESSADSPTGVLVTEDSGQTWTPASGPAAAGWLAAVFPEPHEGVVAGLNGQLSMVAAMNVAPPRFDQGSRRSIHGLAMADGFNGWAVGDGALVLRTQNGAVSWEPALTQLARQIGRFADFKAVAARGKSVWIAGSPGSVVWRSTDNENWSAARTGQTAPINALYFSDEQHGWAVGMFGTILRTNDGGSTWRAMRAGSRRAALLTAHSSGTHIPFNTLVKYAGEQGYRTWSVVIPSHDTAPDGSNRLAWLRQLSDATTTIGAGGAESGWRLPLDAPDLTSSESALVPHWQQITEGELAETMLSHLVAKIRIWRPSILILDAPDTGDAPAKLAYDAFQRAVHDAADAAKYPDQIRYAGLSAWQVEKVFVAPDKDSAAGRSVTSVRPFEVLPRLGATAELLASTGRSKLLPAKEHTARDEMWVQAAGFTSSQFELVAVNDLWHGIGIGSGSDARRKSLPLDEESASNLSDIAVKQRNFRSIVSHYGHSPVKAAQLLAEVRSFTKQLPDAQAAHQLAALAADYRRHSRWELAEATLIELINLYPSQPVATEAMIWLFQYWSSSEMAWQRSRHVSIDARRRTITREAIVTRLEKIVKEAGRVQSDPLKLASSMKLDPIRELKTTETLPTQSKTDWRQAAEANWHRQAVQMATVIRARLPQLYSRPEIEWPLASVLRKQKQPDLADRLFRQRLTSSSTTQAARLASGELWLGTPTNEAPEHLSTATFAALPPTLDGVLGDECWQEASELRLRSRPDEDPAPGVPYGFAMLSWDADYLYVSASLPRNPSAPTDGPQYEGRRHDMNLTGFDRVTIHLDTDRDYTTSYDITIDQRGHVAEACWEDASWNPKMHVAVDGEPDRWRLEAAIPFTELGPAAPRPGATWAVAVRRAIPYAGRQSWIGTPAETAQPQSFGLIRFR